MKLDVIAVVLGILCITMDDVWHHDLAGVILLVVVFVSNYTKIKRWVKGV